MIVIQKNVFSRCACRVAPHILFWLFYILFFGLIYGKYGNDYSWYILESVYMLPFVMLATYVSIYAILSFYLKQKKLFISVLMMISLLFFTTLGERICLRLINDLEVNSETLFGITFLYLLLETNFMVGIAFSIKLVKKWFEQQREKHDMEKKNLQTELNLLKTQLQPHFLFNTMNNLYALSLEESAKTSEGIARISELLRSVLYECNEPEILLENEVAMIKNYIELEQMRYGDRLDVQFHVKGPVAGMKIAPMLLFTFVENCFKHGSRNDPYKPYISINLEVVNNAIIFYTVNSNPEKTVPKRGVGIGLTNVKKRLGIIYGDNYRLKITDKRQKFSVSLIINRKEERC